MKINFIALLATAMLTISVLSCKKQDAQPDSPDQLTETTARAYFENHVKKLPKTETFNSLPIGEPNWDSAYEKHLNIGDGIAVPLKMQSYQTHANGGKVKGDNYLLIYKKQDGSLTHEVVTVMPATSHENIATFNGTVFVRDWSGNVLKGFKYEEGKYKAVPITIGNPRSPQTEIAMPCAEPPVTVCFDTGSGYYCIVEVPVSSCPTTGGSDGGGGGTGGGGYPGGGNSPGGVSPGVYPNPGSSGGYGVSIREITDQLTTPCFKNVLYQVNSISLQNAVSNILIKFFSLGVKLNLTFKEAALAPTTDGETTGTLYSNGDADLVITLNSVGLKSASKEYVAATLFHEIVHAYFNLRGKHPLEDPNYLQHQEMAGFYVDAIAKGVREIYPSTNKDDSEALAWGGLETSLAYQSIVNNKPILAYTIARTNLDHRGGLSGTKCK